MILRKVSDLRIGDAVRPFADDRLWHVREMRWPGPSDTVRAYRMILIVMHPMDGPAEIEVSLDDMVRLG